MKYQLNDLIANDSLQMLVDMYCAFTGMATGILDADGVLLVSSGWQPICTDFHQQCPETKLRCQTSDKHLNRLARGARYVSRECSNGLIHYAARIEVDHHHLGSFVISQIFHSPPDRQRFIRQAREYGFDEDSYLRALDQVRIISPADMKRNLHLLMDLTQLLVQMVLERMQRIAAEEASITSDKHLNLVIESSQDGFWSWEKGHDLIMSNRCAEIITFPSDELRQPQDWLNRIHSQDLPTVISHLEDHIADRLPGFSSEYRFLTRSGQWKWILAKAIIISRDKDYLPAQIAGTISDITERKQVEMELLERESLYRSLVDTSPSAIALTDISGMIKFINPQGAALFGWNDASRLVGQSGHVLLHTKEWGKLGLDYHSVMVTAHPRQTEYTCVHRDGTTFIAEFNIAPIYDASHRLTGCISIAQDITTRKLMETELLRHRNHLQKLVEENTLALRISEQKFSKAFTASPIAMSIATLEEGRYLDVNDAFCTLMGYEREEIVGQMRPTIWNHPQDRDDYKQMIKDRGLVKDLEFTFVTRSGEIRIGLLSGQHIQIGDDTFILSSVIDITEKRRIDREMDRVARLNVIGEMAASIGHEIRNP